MKLNIIRIVLLGAVVTACNNTGKTNVAETATNVIDTTNFNFISLTDLKYKPADITPGTEVEVLANLDGPRDKGDTVFYYQFIVLNKKSGDTLRILCPEITVETGNDPKTSTTPLLFDPEKGVTTASYELIDSSANLLLNEANIGKLADSEDTAATRHLLTPGNAIKIVVLDKHDTKDRISRFKTAVGVLNFKKIPWKT